MFTLHLNTLLTFFRKILLQLCYYALSNSLSLLSYSLNTQYFKHTNFHFAAVNLEKQKNVDNYVLLLPR